MYRNHFFTDGQTDGQTDSHGETSIPPQLHWQGYTNLFSMWRYRWKITPWKSKFHLGSHFFTTCGSKFNIKFWTVSAFNVEKWPGESLWTLKNDPGSHFSTGSLFNVTPAKMEYFYSGTESLWYGNWNHLVCRRWKCEVDHPSQSTEVNLGIKQKWCSLWCPWSQLQQDTSGPDNFRIQGCLWTIYYQCTCKWDWTENDHANV